MPLKDNKSESQFHLKSLLILFGTFISNEKIVNMTMGAESGVKLSQELKDTSWKSALAPEFEKPYFRELENFLTETLNKRKKIYPPIDLVFEALNKTPLDSVKVVILGQDPYHGHGQAHGLCFSVQGGGKIPRSLKNILKELGQEHPTSGNLTPWAKQGVLLLNCIMTVEKGAPGSHKKQGWEKFTDKIISLVSETATANSRPLALLLWGRPAQKKEKRLTPGHKHMVVKSSHPCPRSCYRSVLGGRPFSGSRPFKKVNGYLESKNQKPIVWSLK
jgi:uracil-DNA glycosylase